MSFNSEIKLYNAQRCHKTRFYQSFLERKNREHLFFDVEQNENYAEELRALYPNRQLHFPTLIVGNKKLRNPTEKDLNKWIDKLK